MRPMTSGQVNLNAFPSACQTGRIFGPCPYFFNPGGGAGTTAAPLHFPLPALPPISRPDASRCVPVDDPDGLPLVVELPVSRPEASRYWVLVAESLRVRLSAVPVPHAPA